MSSLLRVSRTLLVAVVAMGVAAFAFAGGEQEAEAMEASPLALELFGDVEPLAEPTELTISLGAGWSQTMPFWMIEEIGGFDMMGIDVSFEVFGNGPVMVEALGADAWDMGSYGLGGIITGTIQHEAVLLGPSIYDRGSLQYFAAHDHPIVLAGNNVSDAPELYGTADTWRGREIYVQTGTTLHYALIKGLDHFGLTGDDVRLTHMDVPNANAALRSGSGDEVAGLWASNVFDESLLARFTPVLKGADVGVELIATLVANPRSYADPQKTLAIKKVIELYYIASEWVMANLEEAVEDYFQPMSFDQGFDAPAEALVQFLALDPIHSFDEAYHIVTATRETDYGELPLLTAGLLDATEFFVGMGNYEPDVLDKLVTVFDTTYLEEIYEARN